MNTYIQSKTSFAVGFIAVVTALILIVALIGSFSPNVKAAYTGPQLSSQLDFGMQNDQVRNLQSFLASIPNIYPEGLVTGYFGPLTRSAVIRFQAAYGIDQVGRVGPLTLLKINSLIGGGLGFDINAPIFIGSNVSVSGSTATISWATNEAAHAKVFYAASPLSMLESSAANPEPTIGGSVAMSTGNANSGSVTLNGLQSNTTYYYVIEVIDASGNVSVTVQKTFRTM